MLDLATIGPLLVISYIPSKASLNSSVETLFADFSSTFASYNSTQELQYRKSIFASNLQVISELNDMQSSASFSYMTPWADRTQDEFARMHGLSPDTICQFATPAPQLRPSAVPARSLDYVALGATVSPSALNSPQLG